MVYNLDEIGPDDLKQIPFGKARNLKRDRYNRTHPDAKQNAKLMFLWPNKYWRKHPDVCDVLGFDGKKAPKVEKLPSKGLFGQVVNYNGKNYVAGKDGKFKTTQRGIEEYKK